MQYEVSTVSTEHSPRTRVQAQPWWLRRRCLEPAILLCLCAILFAQVVLKDRRVSSMADEATHLYSGYRALKCSDFGFSSEHPPLAKMVAAAPLVAMRFPVNCAPVDWRDEADRSEKWLYGGHWERALLWSRLAATVFALGVCVLVWLVARKMFGVTAAIIATTLLLFEPNFLASAGLVTTDVAPTLFFLLAVYAFYLWALRPSLLRGAAAGIGIGLTLVSKHSGVVLVPTICLLAILDAFLQPKEMRVRWRMVGRNLLAVALMLLVAVGVIWTAYGWQSVPNPHGGEPLRPFPSLDQTRIVLFANTGEVIGTVQRMHVLPQAYATGLGVAMGIAGGGNTSGAGPIYIFGRIRPHGKWWFFPAILIVKYTAAFLILIPLAAFSRKELVARHRREVLFLGVPAAVYLLVCTTARLNSGIRHTLPILPFLLILAAAGCLELSKRRRWVRFALPALLLVHVVSSLHAYPFYDSYANEFWGGPANLYKHLPNTDSDQAYRAVAEYMRRYPGVPCWIKTDFQSDPRAYGVPCQPFGASFSGGLPPEADGIVIVSSTSLRSLQSIPHEALTSFAKRRPDARLAGSAMLVYRGRFDTSVAAAYSEILKSERLLSKGDFPSALSHAQLATQAAPGNAMGRAQYCRTLAALNDYDAARFQCNLAVALSSERYPDETVAQGLGEAVLAHSLLDQGQEARALPHAQRATLYAPLSGTARWDYCLALTANRQPAESECYLARVLVMRQSVPHPNNLGPFSNEVAGILHALGPVSGSHWKRVPHLVPCFWAQGGVSLGSRYCATDR